MYPKILFGFKFLLLIRLRYLIPESTVLLKPVTLRNALTMASAKLFQIFCVVLFNCQQSWPRIANNLLRIIIKIINLYSQRIICHMVVCVAGQMELQKLINGREIRCGRRGTHNELHFDFKNSKCPDSSNDPTVTHVV